MALCCMDFSIKHKLGNLFKDKLSTIYKGNEVLDIHNGNSCKSDYDTICRKCHVAVPQINKSVKLLELLKK